jgi:hypothetical protein
MPLDEKGAARDRCMNAMSFSTVYTILRRLLLLVSDAQQSMLERFPLIHSDHHNNKGEFNLKNVFDELGLLKFQL